VKNSSEKKYFLTTFETAHTCSARRHSAFSDKQLYAIEHNFISASAISRRANNIISNKAFLWYPSSDHVLFAVYLRCMLA